MINTAKQCWATHLPAAHSSRLATFGVHDRARPVLLASSLRCAQKSLGEKNRPRPTGWYGERYLQKLARTTAVCGDLPNQGRPDPLYPRRLPRCADHSLGSFWNKPRHDLEALAQKICTEPQTLKIVGLDHALHMP